MVRIERITPNSLPQYLDMDTACKHPRVRIVAREDDVEYLECLECGEVFDSEELRDMTIEEKPGGSEMEEEGKED